MSKKKFRKLGTIPTVGAVRVDEETGFQPVAGELPLYDDGEGRPTVLEEDVDRVVEASLGRRPKPAEDETPNSVKGKSQAGYSKDYATGWEKIFGKKKRPKQG